MRFGRQALTPGREAFEAVALPHLEAVLRFALSLMRGHRGDAEDLAQETFLRAFASFPRFEAGTNVRAWLFRILRNAYVDLLRRRGREPEAEGEEHSEEANRLAAAEFRARAARERAAADLEAALARLPVELRTVILLADGEGMPYAEIAQVMECPMGTVRSRLHRARRLVRQHLLAIWRGQDPEGTRG